MNRDKLEEVGQEEVYMEKTKFEIIGVKPIPRKYRYMNSSKIFIFWAMASASATTPLIGYLLDSLGLIDILIAFTISLLIGLIPAGLFQKWAGNFQFQL